MKYTLAYKKKIADLTWNRLDKEFPDAACSLDIDEHYFFLIRAILSAQCTDIRVNVTVNELKRIAKDVDYGLNKQVRLSGKFSFIFRRYFKLTFAKSDAF